MNTPEYPQCTPSKEPPTLPNYYELNNYTRICNFRNRCMLCYLIDAIILETFFFAFKNRQILCECVYGIVYVSRGLLDSDVRQDPEQNRSGVGHRGRDRQTTRVPVREKEIGRRSRMDSRQVSRAPPEGAGGIFDDILISGNNSSGRSKPSSSNRGRSS